MALNIEQKRTDNKLELILNGKLTNSTAPQLFDVVSAIEDSITNLIFDFKDLDYLSSAGIRVLIEAGKKMNGKGEMLIRHPNDSIMEIFTITNLVELFKIEQ